LVKDEPSPGKWESKNYLTCGMITREGVLSLIDLHLNVVSFEMNRVILTLYLFFVKAHFTP
jgi:hypothetical protein